MLTNCSLITLLYAIECFPRHGYIAHWHLFNIILSSDTLPFNSPIHAILPILHVGLSAVLIRKLLRDGKFLLLKFLLLQWRNKNDISPSQTGVQTKASLPPCPLWNIRLSSSHLLCCEPHETYYLSITCHIFALIIIRSYLFHFVINSSPWIP